MEETFKIVCKEKVYYKTGIQFQQFNTLFQLLSEKKREVNLLNRTDKMLLIPDFLNFLLTGIKKAEYTIVSTTSLADPLRRNWSWDLIDAFDLPRRIFPEIVEPGTVLGKLQKTVAEESGLNENIPVFASANHDTASAVVSAPAFDQNWAFLSSGTWSLMGIELEHSVLTSEAVVKRNIKVF